MKPWKTLDSVDTADGALELRKRGEKDYLITIAGRVLMTSSAHRSELAVAELACQRVSERKAPRVLIGGLGMGYTLRAALDTLPAKAVVEVAELTPRVVDWCRGEMAHLTKDALSDPRSRVHVGDVCKVIAGAKSKYDAIVLDLYEGPHEATQQKDDPFYGAAALANTQRALTSGGVFTVWGEERDSAFEKRLRKLGFEFRVESHGGGRKHPVYVATLA